MKLKILISLFLISFIFGQQIKINSINDFNRIQIVYNLPDYLNPKILLYTDSQKEYLQEEYSTTNILRPSKELKRIDHEKEWKKSGRNPRIEKKNITDYKRYKNYYIVQAINDDCCHVSTDILVWEIENSNLLLKALYPYHVGGCLYCKSELSEIKNDTIIFKTTGRDAEDIYGYIEYYIFREDSLHKVKVVKYDGFDSNGHYNIFYKNYYYNKDEEIISSSINFINKINGKDQYAYPKNDSLQLYLITADYMPYSPKYIKTISLKNDSIKVGKFMSDMVTVLWENEWYITYIKYLDFK